MFSVSKQSLRLALGLLESNLPGKENVDKPQDVTDQEYGNIYVRELNDLKSTLEVASNETLAAIDSLQEGVCSLYKVWKATICKPEWEQGKEYDESKEIKQQTTLRIEDLDESATLSLSNAKMKLQAAKVKSKEVFDNEELGTLERVLGMKIRVTAIILESMGVPDSYTNILKEIGSPEESCRNCLKELHALPDVVRSFKTQLSQQKEPMIHQEGSADIVCAVCLINHAIFNVTLEEGGDPMFWPDVDIEGEHVDPLRDYRMIQVLQWVGMETSNGMWAFGQGGLDGHKILCPSDLATNTHGEFIVADLHDVKIFSSSGKFLNSLRPANENNVTEQWFVPISVSTDGDGNVFVLAELKVERTESTSKTYEVQWRGVFVFDKDDNLSRKFAINENISEGISLTINSDGHVFVLGESNGKDHVEVYGSDGQFKLSFGEDIFDSALYITAADEGQVMVLDPGHQCVHLFSARGDHVAQFNVEGDMDGAITFNHVTNTVCVTTTSRQTDDGQVEVYTKEGIFLYTIQLDTWDNPGLSGAAVTADGRFCLVSGMECKVFVL